MAINIVDKNIHTIIENEFIKKRRFAVSELLDNLMVDNDKFDYKNWFVLLLEYLEKYERILYTPISNKIYCLSEDDENAIPTIMSNLDKILDYIDDSDSYKEFINSLDKTKHNKQLDAKKSIIKIWDHINLAQQQYQVLKQTDQEYNERFQHNIEKHKNEITREMSQQLISLVGIFTALAFLIFGGISSLDDIFSIHGIPLIKLMCTGTVWGISILNLVFVFLFCVSKMTNTAFKSTNNLNANIFQKYPIVWWCNFILFCLLMLFTWVYYLTSHGLLLWFDRYMRINNACKVIVGSIIIFVIILTLFITLVIKSKPLCLRKK